MAVNEERLEHERGKLDRYYDHRVHVAEEKLQSAERTLQSVQSSDDEGRKRIIPVWGRNVENARKTVLDLPTERARRLADLMARQSVTSQHQLLTVSHVRVVHEQPARPAVAEGTPR